MLWDETDADILALMAARLNRTSIAIAALTGAKTTSGIIGIWGDFVIPAPSQNQAIGNEQTIKFTLHPAKTSVHPQWIVVA